MSDRLLIYDGCLQAPRSLLAWQIRRANGEALTADYRGPGHIGKGFILVGKIEKWCLDADPTAASVETWVGYEHAWRQRRFGSRGLSGATFS